MREYLKKMFLVVLGIIISSSINVFAQDNPLFVTITANSCFTCQKLKPVIEELEYEYGDRIKFVTLDVSSKSSIDFSKQMAEELEISEFFVKNMYAVPRVGIICPGGGKVEQIFIGETNKNIYKESIENLLLDSHRLCSL